MSKVYKTSRAIIASNVPNIRYVYVLDSGNPERIIAKALRDYMEILGYSDVYPNFENLRVGTVHPFAMLLAQDVLDKPKNVNVFPSVTISDTNTDETAEVLSDDYAAITFTEQDIITLGGFRESKDVFISNAGWKKILTTVKDRGIIIGIRRRYRTVSAIDFNIWTENKEITSFIFDSVCHFIIQERPRLHREKSMDLSRVSGRRSGDINLDFGMLLYGANVRAQATIAHESVVFDTEIHTIKDLDTKTFPEYFVPGGYNG